MMVLIQNTESNFPARRKKQNKNETKQKTKQKKTKLFYEFFSGIAGASWEDEDINEAVCNSAGATSSSSPSKDLQFKIGKQQIEASLNQNLHYH